EEDTQTLNHNQKLFSVVILGCISNEGYINRPEEEEEFCIFNRNQNACNYGVGMGMLCFLCCGSLMALDIYFPQISGVKDRKKAVMADIGMSAFWSLMWFVGFCFLANQWQVSEEEDNPLDEGGDAARAAILFSFFSVFTWVCKHPDTLKPRHPDTPTFLHPDTLTLSTLTPPNTLCPDTLTPSTLTAPNTLHPDTLTPSTLTP
uniref:Synaptogyrin 1 n=1 Tax=Myripristis murdjan TaxID=586833 RepID=A0A667WFZ9_9TELE